MEKNSFLENDSKKERFEFIFSVNGNIICQRYFKIDNFKEKSLGSIQLSNTIDSIVADINRDLKVKTNIYLTHTAPQVFASKEEMEKWVKNPTFKIDNPAYVVLRDSDDMFIWNGESMLPYSGQFNRNDYVEENTTPCIFKFAFLDNGKEVHSVSWDGNVYPKFVRTNIDLSNSKNRYKGDGIYAPMEEFLIDTFNASQTDLIPRIVKKIRLTCAFDNEGAYYKYMIYGGKKYHASIEEANAEYEAKVEASYRKKTNAYFND